MKKIISILFSVIFIYSSLIYFANFQLAHTLNKHYSKENFEKLLIPTQKLSELKWIEKNKEFRYKGTMYDVVKIDKNANNYVFYVYKDKKDTELFSEFLLNYDKKNHNNKTKKKIGKKTYFYKKLFKISAINLNVKYNFLEKTDNYNLLIIGKISPPPKRFL